MEPKEESLEELLQQLAEKVSYIVKQRHVPLQEYNVKDLIRDATVALKMQQDKYWQLQALYHESNNDIKRQVSKLAVANAALAVYKAAQDIKEESDG